jgi:predicted GNAT family acetyltransferase
MPVAPLDDDRVIVASLRELRRVFAERRRTLRFEFTGELWPTLVPTLTNARLKLQAAQPLMLCGSPEFRPFTARDVQVRLLTAADDRAEHATYLEIQSKGFGDGPPAVSDEDVARLGRRLREGQLRAALARLGGVPAGTGAITGHEGIGELVGVATLPAMRHRGVATTVSAFLVQEHFNLGHDLAWLSAADAYAQAVYARIGFRLLGTLLNYIEDGAEVRT